MAVERSFELAREFPFPLCLGLKTSENYPDWLSGSELLFFLLDQGPPSPIFLSKMDLIRPSLSRAFSISSSPSRFPLSTFNSPPQTHPSSSILPPPTSLPLLPPSDGPLWPYFVPLGLPLWSRVLLPRPLWTLLASLCHSTRSSPLDSPRLLQGSSYRRSYDLLSLHHLTDFDVHCVPRTREGVGQAGQGEEAEGELELLLDPSTAFLSLVQREKLVADKICVYRHLPTQESAALADAETLASIKRASEAQVEEDQPFVSTKGKDGKGSSRGNAPVKRNAKKKKL